MAVAQDYRRRFEASLLRWQGRLDMPEVDRVLPWIYSAILFVVLASLSLARYRSIDTGVDLAGWVQGAWLLGEGVPPESTITGNHIFAPQAAFGFWPIAQIARILPTAPTLLVIQSAALAVAVVPLYRLARRSAKLRVGAATVLVLAYSLYPAVHSLNLADFHPEALAVPAFIAAFVALRAERWWRFALLVSVAVLMRADLALAVAGLGVLLASEGHRRAGIWTTVLALGWFSFAVLIVEPALIPDGVDQVEYLSHYGDTPLGVAGGILTNPLEFLGDVFSRANFEHMVGLFAPLLFLPLVAPRYFLPIVPLQMLYLAASVPEEAPAPELNVPAISFLLVAATFALARTGQIRVELVNVDNRVLVALAVTAVVFFLRDAPSTAYEEPWHWASRSSEDQARRAAIDLVPDDIGVQATSSALTMLAERDLVYELDTSANVIQAERGLRATEFVLFDQSDAESWSTVWVDNFDRNLQRDGYIQVYRAEGVVLYQRR
ncbi:MAG: DUF2079 domain-containing protein [Acidimicrobiia bacterium]|nr:DUF2079 domain-containing protein [Acidimicrobiia bacterium]